MQPRIDVCGIVSLREEISNSNERDNRYYAALNFDIETEGAERYGPKRVEVAVYVTPEHYKDLKMRLENSNAEVARLEIRGKLDLEVKPVSIN